MICPKCGTMMEATDCWNCGGEGYSHHDCGEDTCICFDKSPNIVCDECNGKGGWWVCLIEECEQPAILFK